MKKNKKDESYSKLIRKDFVVNNYDNARGEMKNFYDNIDAWDNQYECKEYKRMYDGLANVSVPETFKAIQALKSRIINYTFGTSGTGFFRIKEAMGVPPDVIDGYTKVMKLQQKEANFEIEYEKAVLTALKNGTAIVKVYEDEDIVKKKMPVALRAIDERTGMPVVDPMTGEPATAGYEEQEITEIKRLPTMQNMNWKNIAIVGNTHDFNKADAVIERIDNVDWEWLWINRKHKVFNEELQQEIEVGIYEGLEEAKAMNSMPATNTAKDNEWDDDRYDNPKVELETAKDKEREKRVEDVKHQLLECWTYWDLDGDGYKEPVIMTVLDEKHLIRCEPNPYNHQKIPYLLVPCFIKENDFYGLGMCQMTNSLQNELNARRNQTIDNMTAILCNMWVVTDKKIPMSDLKFRPNGVIKTTHKDAVTPLRTPLGNLQAGVMADSMLKDDIQTTTGATKSLQGEQLNQGTATEVRTTVAEGNYRVIDIVKNFENFLLKPFIEMQHSNNQQFIEQEMVQTIKVPPKPAVIENGQMVSPSQPSYDKQVTMNKSDILFSADFEVDVASEVENKTIKVQQAQNFLQILLNSGLPPQMTMPGSAKLIRKIWNYQDLGDPDEIITQEMVDQISLMAGQPPQGAGGQGTNEQGLMQQTMGSAKTPVQGGNNGGV